MEYSTYIQNDNARREREIQLANQYNQRPVNKFKEVSPVKTAALLIIEIIAGLIIVSGLILASIWL